MAANYVLLERIELNASAASISFTNIPQSGYTDLKLVFSARDDNSAVYNNMLLTFNGSTTGYSERVLGGTGSAAFSSSQSASSLQYQYINSANSTANSFSNGEFYIPNYTSSNNKSVSVDNVQENNATSAVVGLAAQLWSNSAAITTIKLEPASSKLFQANSTFSLYGLAAVGTTPAIAPKASGGNRIDYDGTYWIHTFTTTGTFVPTQGLTCDALVVAGGGAGGTGQSGGQDAGGGGAGGFRTGTGLSLATATSYTVTVGAGGAASTVDYARGGNGTNSSLSTISSTGGGGGGGASGANASQTGGSGGGGAINQPGAAGNAGSYSPVEGYAGGAGFGTSQAAGGGGGGSSAVGVTSTVAGVAGAGGAGTANSYSGSSVTYAGGGGGGADVTGGAGGTGGGGAGSSAGSTNSVAGTTNTGGGGGGGSAGSNPRQLGSNGGSGIVIIRYLA